MRNKFLITLAISLIFYANSAYSQLSFGGTPKSIETQNDINYNSQNKYTGLELKTLEAYIIYDNPDWEKIHNEDSFNNMIGMPMRAGISFKAGLNPQNSGTWDTLNCGTLIWRVKIHSPGAKSLSLIIDDFNMPENAGLFVYDESEEHIIGAFTSKNNNKNKFFSTHLLPGDVLIVEYNQYLQEGIDSQYPSPEFRFNIDNILYNYVSSGPFGSISELRDAGACNVNINCPEGSDWQKEKRGVAKMLYLEGANWYFCTGSLVNNTNNDATPYFLTADHCGGSASAANRNLWQFYFNYERPGCANTGSPPNHMITGASKIASGELSGGSDFQLVELNSSPPAAWEPYFNGWSRSNVPSLSGVSIHHPSGDVKKISTYTSPLRHVTVTVGNETMANGSCWGVTWVSTASGHGVTEGGSSGSPIFNSSHQIIGTLVGGNSSCANTGGEDFYGKFGFHWDTNGSSENNQLKPWLDPAETNTVSHHGYDPSGTNIVNQDKHNIKAIVFPNPANNKLNVEVFYHSHYTLKVMNLHGSTLFSKKSKGEKTHYINISDLPNGIYIVNISGKTIDKTLKFVKIN